MQYYDNILTVEANWLIDNGIMTKSTYDKLNVRKDINVVRRGCRGQQALVAYDSMPERFRRKVEQRIDPRRAALDNPVADRVSDNAATSRFFSEYRLDDGRHLPREKQREYYANAVVLDAVRGTIEARQGKRRALGHTASRFWEELCGHVREVDRTRWPHTLPDNPRSLERKYKRYQEEGPSSLIHKSYLTGSKNAAKVAGENQETALSMLINDPRKLDDAQVSRLYNLMAGSLGWKKITRGTVARWRDKLDSEVYARRNGYWEWRNNRAMQVKRKAPSFPLYFWTMDGWTAELLYQSTGRDGRTTYHHRLTIVVVLDAFMKYPVGYAIGREESASLIREALRDAMRHTGQLFGGMYRTAQLQSDNFAKSAIAPWCMAVADKYTPAEVGNAKSKIIEPWFRHFNKTRCQLEANWSGFGVKSRKESQPNTSLLMKNKKDYPDFAGVCAQLAAGIEAERAELREGYLAGFAAMPEEHKKAFPLEQYLLAFGEPSESRYLLRGTGIRVTLDGVKHDYECFDPAFRSHATVRWQVVCDPADPSHALAVNDDGTLRFLLEEKYVQPMALIERKEGDYEQLRRVFDFNERLEAGIAARIGERQERMGALLEGRAELEVLQKMLMTDDRGQHKARLSEARRKLAASMEKAAGNPEADLLDEY